MRTLILPALALPLAFGFSAPGVSAQAAGLVSVSHLDGGRFQVTRETRTQVVDLAAEVAGCTGILFDRTVGEEYGSGVDVAVVDETAKAPFTYLLLLVSAPPNCNVQGHCGAGGPDVTLVWLKLTEDLSIAGRQSAVLDDCRQAVWSANTRPADDEAESGEIRAADLPWDGDVLKIDLEGLESGPIGSVTYDRREPEAGLRTPGGSGTR